MAVVCSQTEIARGVNTTPERDRAVDLRYSSLAAVVGSNGTLFCRPPRKWTQAHLQALCINRLKDTNVDDRDRDQYMPFLRAVVPDVPQGSLDRWIGSMARHHDLRCWALALGLMLRFEPPKGLCINHLKDTNVDDRDRDQYMPFLHAVVPDLPQRSLEDEIDAIARYHFTRSKALALNAILVYDKPPKGFTRDYNPQLKIKALSFSHVQDCILKLAIGQRVFRLPPMYKFSLGSLMLPVLVSSETCDLSCWPTNKYPSLHSCEPCISAILIAMAQESNASTNDTRPIQTRLLFKYHPDKDNIYVYTARISQALLERLRYPRVPPTAHGHSDTMPYLANLHCKSIPFKPTNTFRCRLLAALSITATTTHPDDYYSSRERKLSNIYEKADLSAEQKRSDAYENADLSRKRKRSDAYENADLSRKRERSDA